jgi:hypothetical protein
MIKIYAEKEIFENIVLSKDQYPNLNKILTNQAEVCLNMTDKDLDNEEIEGTVVFEYIKSAGGRSPIALKEYFEDVYENNEIIADKPRSAFFLNCSNEKAAQLQEDYGVIVQSKYSIDDKILSGAFFKELQKNEEYIDEFNKGWSKLLSFDMPPLNSVIIIDNYLLLESTKINGENIYFGKDNIVELLKAILPKNLSTTFHVSIISEEDKKNRQELKKKIELDIKSVVRQLRAYEIVVEFFWIPAGIGFHKRRMLCNYVNATCDKGFAVFKSVNGKQIVVDDNDLRFNRVFNNLDNNIGDTDFESATKALEKTNKILNNCGQKSSNRLINNI